MKLNVLPKGEKTCMEFKKERVQMDGMNRNNSERWIASEIGLKEECKLDRQEERTGLLMRSLIESPEKTTRRISKHQ